MPALWSYSLQVACGSGLVRIYDFLRSDEISQYPKDRMDRSKKVEPSDVANGALDKSDPVAGVLG
jgi:glucokinase